MEKDTFLLTTGWFTDAVSAVGNEPGGRSVQITKESIRKDQLVWQTPKCVIYKDDDGGYWRYMPELKMKFPVTFGDVSESILKIEESWEGI